MLICKQGNIVMININLNNIQSDNGLNFKKDQKDYLKKDKNSLIAKNQLFI